MYPDVLGELVGRIIAEQVGQIVARCADLRAELERRITALDHELERFGPRVDVLEKVQPPPPPEMIDHEAMAERVLARVLERLPSVLEGQGLGLHALATHVASIVEARLPVPKDPPEPVKGEPGVGIAAIDQPEPGSILVRLDDGRSFPFALPRGPAGEDGRFRAPTSWKGEGKHLRGEIVIKDGGCFWVGDDDHLVPLAVGVRAIWSESDDPREHAIVVVRSDDTVDRLGIHIPVPIHRGAYDPEAEYEPGDEVAHNGATWRCRASGRALEPPGEVWYLVAKQGRPGRPGEPGSGKDGTGIRSVWRQDNALVFSLDNGDTQSVELPE